MRALEETLLQRVKKRADGKRDVAADRIAHYQGAAADADLLDKIASAIEGGATISPDDLLWLATGPSAFGGLLGAPENEHQRLRIIAQKVGV